MRILHELCNRIWKTSSGHSTGRDPYLLCYRKRATPANVKNNRTISLISHANKVLLYIIANRMEAHLDRNIPNSQTGFRKGRGTRDQIANLRWLIEKAIERNRKLLLVFIDYSKAFDCVDHDTLWNIVTRNGFPCAHHTPYPGALQRPIRHSENDIYASAICSPSQRVCVKGVYYHRIFSTFMVNI